MLKTKITTNLVTSLFVTSLIVTLGFSANASADTASTSQGTLESSIKRFSFATSLTRSNSLYNREDGSEQASWDLSLSPSYKISKDLTTYAIIEGSQDIKAEEADLSRGAIGLRKKGILVFSERTELSPSLSLGFPVSKSQRAASFQSSVTAGLRISATPGSLVLKKLSLGGNLSLTRNFHEFDTAISGQINTQYVSVQSFDMGWSFTDKLSVGLAINHYDLQSYTGKHKDFYSHSQEVGFSLTEKTSIALGHQYGSPFVSTLKANGQDLNVAVMDETNSFVYGQLTLTY